MPQDTRGSNYNLYVLRGTTVHILSEFGSKTQIAKRLSWESDEQVDPLWYCDPVNKRAPPAPTPVAGAAGAPAQVSGPETSFIYLDVGLWAGSKFASIQRDFGIVCGSTVALCCFRPDKYKTPLTGLPNQITNGQFAVSSVFEFRTTGPTSPNKEFVAINQLLTALATPTNNDPKGSSLGSLGKPFVRRWDVAAGKAGSATRNNTKIYVIVGDMHLPVTDDPLGKRYIQNDPPNKNKSWGRHGVVDGAPFGGQDQWWMKYTGSELSDMSTKETPRKSVGADIFENAGGDLLEFVMRLQSFTHKPDEGDGAPLTLHLLQLGDMVDLWIGLDCFFTQGDGINFDSAKSNPSAEQFVNYWTTECLTDTAQSAGAMKFLQFTPQVPTGTAATAPFKTFMWGNHDCYFAKPNPKILLDASGAPRQPNFTENSIVWAEHGHSWDASNWDGGFDAKGIGPGGAWIAPTLRGVGGWMGQDMTNQVFDSPSLRSADPSNRLPSMRGASFIFNNGDPPILCYAMGHTHCPMLVKIVFQPMPAGDGTVTDNKGGAVIPTPSVTDHLDH